MPSKTTLAGTPIEAHTWSFTIRARSTKSERASGGRTPGTTVCLSGTENIRGGSSGGTAGLRTAGSIGRPEASVVWIRLSIWHRRTERLSDSACCASSSAVAADCSARLSESKKRSAKNGAVMSGACLHGVHKKHGRPGARTIWIQVGVGGLLGRRLRHEELPRAYDLGLQRQLLERRDERRALEDGRHRAPEVARSVRLVPKENLGGMILSEDVPRRGRVDSILPLVVAVLAPDEAQQIHIWIRHDRHHVGGGIARVDGEILHALADDRRR